MSNLRAQKSVKPIVATRASHLLSLRTALYYLKQRATPKTPRSILHTAPLDNQECGMTGILLASYRCLVFNSILLYTLSECPKF